jgi:hypothetical protein
MVLLFDSAMYSVKLRAQLEKHVISIPQLGHKSNVVYTRKVEIACRTAAKAV